MIKGIDSLRVDESYPGVYAVSVHVKVKAASHADAVTVVADLLDPGRG